MGQILAGDRTLLRQPVESHHSVERLYLFGAPNVWTGRVNEAPARGDRTITYDAVGVGEGMAAGFAFADLTSYGAGLEVWFGTTAGGKERGVRRLRSMGVAEAAGNMVVDWHDDLDLANDDYITIKHFYPPWPKFSYFTAAGPAFYKDGPDGTLYAASGDANDTPAPHVIMGRNFAGEMPAAGTLTIQCDATNSVDVAGGGGAVTYAWDVTPPGGAAFNNTAIGAPELTLSSAGQWWIHCTVTINGRSTTGHRAVMVGGGIAEFSRSPITTQWDKTDIECQITLTSPDTGATGEIRPVVDWDDFQDGGLVIVAATDYYGTTQKSISFRDDGVYDDRNQIVFCGYILLENDDLIEDGSGAVQFTAVSLVDMFLYSQSLTGVVAASQWYEMNRTFMTVAGNLLHLFRWHSTLLDIADWWLPWADTVRRSANEEFGEGDIFERARALCRARLMGMTATPQGEVFVETDLNLRSQADRAAATTTMTLTEADIAGTKRVRMRRRGEVARVLADGGYSTGIMNSFQPFFSASANVALSQARPSLMHPDRLMAPTQAEMNRIAARLGAVTNRKYAEVDLAFKGNYREIFSPADQQWTNLGNLFAASVKANIRDDTAMVSALAVPRSVTHAHDNATGQTTVSVVFDVEAPVELEGRTITPPSVPSEDPGDWGWDMPAPPDWPALPEVALSGSLVAFDNTNGCWVLLLGAPDWQERNDGRSSEADEQGGWDPWMRTPLKQNSSDPNRAILWAPQVGRIWRSTDCGVSWLDVTPEIDPPDDYGQTPPPAANTATYSARFDSIHQNKLHVFLVEYYDGSTWGGWLLKTDDDGETGSWTYESLGGAGGSLTLDFETGFDGFIYESFPGWNDANETYDRQLDVTGWCLRLLTSLADAVPRGGTARKSGMSLVVGAGTSITVSHKITGDQSTSDFYVGFSGGGQPAVWELGTHDPEDWHTHTLDLSPYAGRTISYLWWIEGNSKPNAVDSRIDDVIIASGDVQARPVWADVDSESGTYLYLTVWLGSGAAGSLYLQKRLVADLSLVSQVYLGACTQAELFVDYMAYPHTPQFSNDYCYVHGRMTAPAGLGAGIQHVIRTANGGTTWASIENGLGTKIVSALRAEGVVDAARTLYAIANDAGDVPEFHRGLESIAYISDLPFPSGAFVPVDALTVNSDSGKVACASDTAAATMIAESMDDGSNWSDITGSFPVDGSVRSLTYV